MEKKKKKSFRFQNSSGILAFWIFCKCVKSGVPSDYSEKDEFMLDFDEIMRNRDLTN